MFYNICIILLLVSFKCSSSLITMKQSNAGYVIRNVSNFAIQSRENTKYQISSVPNIFNKQQEYQDQYGQYLVYTKPYSYNQLTHKPFKRPYPYLFDLNQYHHFDEQNIRQNVMDALYSLARNDDLHCVPKLLCEITSGTMYGRQNGVNLPMSINLESLLGVLSSLNGLQSSPLLYFGKAALIGYTSKGNARFCTNAYQECPSDADKLVQYLNNHNGGFFRYFNEIVHKSHASSDPNLLTKYQKLPFYKQNIVAEQRIQNIPVTYNPANFIKNNKGFLFPKDELKLYNRPSVLPSEQRDTFKFPEDSPRRPKILQFYDENILNFEKPLPNHQASPFIFPDRTGTGELVVDSNDFDKEPYIDINNIRHHFFNLNRLNNDHQLFFPESLN